MKYDISQSTAASSAVHGRCRLPSSLVRGQESTICDIVWMSAAVTRSRFVRPNFFSQVPQWPCLKTIQQWPLALGENGNRKFGGKRNWPLLRATHAPVWRMMDGVCWETIRLTNTNSVVISCFLNNWDLSRLTVSSSSLSHLPRFASCSITSHHDLHSKVWTNFHPTRQRAWVDNARQHLGLVTGAQVSSMT